MYAFLHPDRERERQTVRQTERELEPENSKKDRQTDRDRQTKREHGVHWSSIYGTHEPSVNRNQKENKSLGTPQGYIQIQMIRPYL